MLEQQELLSLQLPSTPLLLAYRAEVVFALSPSSSLIPKWTFTLQCLRDVVGRAATSLLLLTLRLCPCWKAAVNKYLC